MNTSSSGLMFALCTLLLLAGCSSPKEKFIAAAKHEDSVTDQNVLDCAAEKLQKEMPEDRFRELTEELQMIADQKKSKEDASLQLMASYTVATAGCAVGEILGLGDKKEK